MGSLNEIVVRVMGGGMREGCRDCKWKFFLHLCLAHKDGYCGYHTKKRRRNEHEKMNNDKNCSFWGKGGEKIML